MDGTWVNHVHPGSAPTQPRVLEDFATAAAMDMLRHTTLYCLVMDSTLDWAALPEKNEFLARLSKMRVVLVPIAFTTHERSHKLCTLGYGKNGREIRQSPFYFCSSRGTD